jgi:hypothetical protein
MVRNEGSTHVEFLHAGIDIAMKLVNSLGDLGMLNDTLYQAQPCPRIYARVDATNGSGDRG